MATSIPGMPGGRGNSSGINSSTMNPSQGFPGYGIPGMPGSGGGTASGWGNIMGTRGGSSPLANPNHNAFWGDSVPYSGDVNKKLYHGLDDVYGENLGTALGYYLANGAGFNQGAINNLFAAMNPTISRSLATLDAGSGVSGTRFGSAHDFGVGNYLSQVYLDQGTLETQMYNDAQNRIYGILTNSAHDAGQTSSGPGLMNQIMSGLQVAGPAVGSGMMAAGASGGWETMAMALMAL